jgi:hypothetical protein
LLRLLFFSKAKTELAVNSRVNRRRRFREVDVICWLLAFRFEMQPPEEKDRVRLELCFEGDLQIPNPKDWIFLSSEKLNCLSVDLLRIYACSLNPRVEELRLRFPGPGKIPHLWARPDD